MMKKSCQQTEPKTFFILALQYLPWLKINNKRIAQLYTVLSKRQAVCETWQGLSQEPRITDLADNAKFKRCKVLNYFS